MIGFLGTISDQHGDNKNHWNVTPDILVMAKTHLRKQLLMQRLWICACLLVCSPFGMSVDAADPVRVMSFNIRYGLAKDGDDVWPNRAELVVDTIKAYQPDLLGTQETLKFQADFLQKNLSDYGYVGRTRDHNENGEQCALFYRTDRFEKVSDDQFWLSETPEVAVSKSWDSSLPRVVTLVVLKDKQNDRTLTFYNTHFDHRGQVARLESAKLLRSKAESLPEDAAVIITGDFNCGEDSKPYAALVGSARLSDSYRLVHPDASPNEGTFNGFKGVKDGARIDWVVHSASFQPISAAIDRTHANGRYPSDHFPVTAVLQWKE